ncbi:hypothetical protein BVX97_05455, partial [bacterium E08(2017)]
MNTRANILSLENSGTIAPTLIRTKSIMWILLFLGLGMVLMPSAVVGAPIPANSKVLIIGPAADTHETALEGLIAGDSTASALNITVESFPTDDLLVSYFSDDDGGVRANPTDTNAFLNKLDESFDVILIHPGERHIRIAPELHMEAVRYVERHTRAQGPRIMLLVPTLDPNYSKDFINPTDFEKLKERVYRIKDALELEAIPVGIAWEAVLQDSGLSATATTVATPNDHAVNVFATAIFSALFETSPASSTFRHGGISDTEYGLISAHAFQSWQNALTATHYTGDYLGIFSPWSPSYDQNRPTVWDGASTEAITSAQFNQIFEGKGMSPVVINRGDPDNFRDDDFWVIRVGANWVDPSMEWYRGRNLSDDLRVINLSYKNYSRSSALSLAGDYKDWYYTLTLPYLTSPKFMPADWVKIMPNALTFLRQWHEFDFRVHRYGESHLNDDASMVQAALIYTVVSGGDSPLSEGIVDKEEWTGRRRYAAGLGYAMIMGNGRLAKLDMPPVAMGVPRYYLQADTANVVENLGWDFNGLPVNVVVDTPPVHGTLVPSGNSFTYTPDPGFTGTDSVTYRVNNGTEDSFPLKILLVVGPYVPPPPSGAVIFEDDFDAQNFDKWTVDGYAEFVDLSNESQSWQNGFPVPIDGMASVMMNRSGGELERAIDTRGFENLRLTVRVASHHGPETGGNPPDAKVLWFDGTTWHELISHGHTYLKNRLFQTYDVDLPPEAANNPLFRFKLLYPGLGEQNLSNGAFFDSVRLCGDIV